MRKNKRMGRQRREKNSSAFISRILMNQIPERRQNSDSKSLFKNPSISKSLHLK